VNVIGRWKRQALCTGTLLAAGLLGSGCLDKEETSGGSLGDRREAQLHAQSFESYGDGRLPQEVKPAAQQATGGSGTVPGSGTTEGKAAQGAPAPQGSSPAAPASAPAAAPAQSGATQEQERPRRDSGSSPDEG
jgi:hypothetical protein